MSLYTEALLMYVMMTLGMAVIIYAMKYYEKDK